MTATPSTLRPSTLTTRINGADEHSGLNLYSRVYEISEEFDVKISYRMSRNGPTSVFPGGSHPSEMLLADEPQEGDRIEWYFDGQQGQVRAAYAALESFMTGLTH